ncbi:hypothetical protein RN001_014262 [Aquatica leii]|uniref:TMC domain-containing protein n=1 Tax=Aquatica leii TaxID=1421715 RepID=A0AAN7P251_9COLE|nr:hypothetical protein RN001_014262 [Aquatica leii]
MSDRDIHELANFGRRRSSYGHRPIFNVENPDYGIQRVGPAYSDVPNNAPYEQAGYSQDYLPETNYDSLYIDDGRLNHYHRTTSIHRNVFRDNNESSDFRTFPLSLENRRKWMFSTGYTMSRTTLEERANNIANCMEQDGALMKNTPESELLRREALRDMPQSLTVKRIIKKKLCSSVNKRLKPISCYKGLQYNLSMKASKINNWFKSLTYTFELWYSSLKVIEGHFGSGVATYFKYFRWLFIMNCLITMFALTFIVFPQLLFDYFTSNLRGNSTFAVSDIFTGEGFFTNTTLYYGHYAKEFVNFRIEKYSIPYAYFFTMLGMYVVSFIVLSFSMAKSYRRSFIETRGGLKNNFAYKIFCGWDYSIATQEAADLKSSSIYHELKELLGESLKTVKRMSWLQKFYTTVLQIVCNFIIIFLLGGTGYILWLLIKQQHSNISEDTSSSIGVLLAIIINLIMLFFPMIFSFIVQYEDYKNPRAALYITLLRTFLLKVVVVGVFIAFWLVHSRNENCWETSIGQHIYRLILFDFVFSVIVAALVEGLCFVLYKKVWKNMGAPKFDIARHTLQLMYNQTLFWVGFYFSPLLSVVVVLKLWLSWYIRRTCVLYFCEPSSKSWRSSQTQTLFLILSFLSLLLVLITFGYIMVDVQTSNCGPFSEYKYVYEMVLIGIFRLEQNNIFWKILIYLTKPGVIALILVGMCVVVYYFRAKAVAQKGMVNILREMLLLEAKDKEFLLKTISKVTEGQWQYQLPKHELSNPYENINELWSAGNVVDIGNNEDTSSGSDNLLDYRSTQQANQSLLNKEKRRNNVVHRKKY